MAKTETNILTPEQDSKLQVYLGDMVARAESPEPKLADFNGDVKAFKKELAAYKSNPLSGMVSEFAAQRDEELKNGASVEEANALYDDNIEGMKDNFINGVRKGGPDENAASGMQAALESIMAGDFMGAIKHFLMSIPVIGDTLAAGGKWLKSKFNGEDLEFGQAKDRITLERALGGASARLGLNDQENEKLINGALRAYEDPNYKPMERAEPNRTMAAAQAQADEELGEDKRKDVVVAGKEQGLDTSEKKLGEVPADTKRGRTTLSGGIVVE